jgi:predicted Zn-dependent peptidase
MTRAVPRPLLLLALLAALPAPPAAGAPGAPRLPIDGFRLDNGMTFLLVERPGDVEVAAGWVVASGSADDPAGATGSAHLLEHLLFEGTRTLGTRDFAREEPLLALRDRLLDERRRLVLEQRRRWRRGEVAEPTLETAPPAGLAALEERLAELDRRLEPLSVPQEIDTQYALAGARGVNAFTMPDLTAYFAAVPANKLELWFWIESDRLLHPVLRHLERELAVVGEERRRKLAAPGGAQDDLFESLFWQAHPYGRPGLGWPSDAETLHRRDLLAHMRRHYVPSRLTAVLVGGFDRQQVETWARAYFGRLPAAEPPPRPATLEPEQTARLVLEAAHAGPPAVRLRYHAAPFGHPDTYALEVAADLLGAPGGRLGRALIEPGLAIQAGAEVASLVLAGHFTLQAVGTPGTDPARLEAVLGELAEGLARETVPAAELEAAKNRLLADGYRGLRDPFRLMVELLIHAGKGDAGELVGRYAGISAVTADDVRRMAQRYFHPERRTVGILRARTAAPAGGQP